MLPANGSVLSSVSRAERLLSTPLMREGPVSIPRADGLTRPCIPAGQVKRRAANINTVYDCTAAENCAVIGHSGRKHAGGSCQLIEWSYMHAWAWRFEVVWTRQKRLTILRILTPGALQRIQRTTAQCLAVCNWFQSDALIIVDTRLNHYSDHTSRATERAPTDQSPTPRPIHLTMYGNLQFSLQRTLQYHKDHCSNKNTDSKMQISVHFWIKWLENSSARVQVIIQSRARNTHPPIMFTKDAAQLTRETNIAIIRVDSKLGSYHLVPVILLMIIFILFENFLRSCNLCSSRNSETKRACNFLVDMDHKRRWSATSRNVGLILKWHSISLIP